MSFIPHEVSSPDNSDHRGAGRWPAAADVVVVVAAAWSLVLSLLHPVTSSKQDDTGRAGQHGENPGNITVHSHWRAQAHLSHASFIMGNFSIANLAFWFCADFVRNSCGLSSQYLRDDWWLINCCWNFIVLYFFWNSICPDALRYSSPQCLQWRYGEHHISQCCSQL